MNEKPAVNRPTLKKVLNVPRVQIPALVTSTAVANISAAADKVKADILKIVADIAPACDKTFIMMKNKKVWFDRNNAAIYPKFEEFTLPQFKTKGQPSKNYSVDFEGFHFVGMTRREGMNSFTELERNPYLQDNGNFRNFPNSENRFNCVLTGDLNSKSGVWYFKSNSCCHSDDTENIFTLVPICRLKGKDCRRIGFVEAVLLWLKNGLVPEGLSDADEREYLRIMNEYKNLFAYLEVNDDEIHLAEKISGDLSALVAELAPACDKTFVMMKNKQVWFDRNNAALYPKFENFSLPRFKYYDTSCANYSADFDGFLFVPMTVTEGLNSFTDSSRDNPYKKSNGDFEYFHNVAYYHDVMTGEIDSNGYPRYIYQSGWTTMNSSSYITLVPIHRLRGKNAATMSYPEALLAWIANGLIPEGLTPKQEKFYQTFMTDYPKLEDYISGDGDTIKFDEEKFKADVLAGRFTEKVFDYDFDIRGTLDGVMNGSRKYTGSVAALKKELLDCDHKRADIEPYDERQLTDVNRGHWELFEDAAADTAEVQLPAGEMLVARPPQLDVRLNGICAIDFGTKSTIVVCRDGEARMLRVGKGDYSKAPTMKDFENPTVIHLRDVEKFLAAYRARDGRPFTEWNQVTVSHQAADAIFQNDVGSSVYNSVFSELKQWAKDEQSYPVLKDLQGFTLEIKPYLETREIDAGNFDPIEIYAYYLGLYINNMHRQIYLDYILSFPVNYRKDIRERIRKSFECGIKKSLPPAILHDDEMMKRFRVYLGASEPAAYAISALEGFELEPKTVGEKVAYGVFDFGGGTTDFDFGIETVPENRRRNFIIEQFGFNGDVTLGGENILELLAYEVYKDNLSVMREKKIPFALPAGCEIFAGAETLVSTTKGAAAHMNTRVLAEKLRPIWEDTDERKNLTEKPLDVTLFSSAQQEEGKYSVGLNLDIHADKLDKCIEDRIRVGVVNFFQSLKSAFSGREVYPVHIFLAGNSCRSPVVKKIFDEFINREDPDKFVLHMPLGFEKISVKEKIAALAEKIATEILNEDAKIIGGALIEAAKNISVAADEIAALVGDEKLGAYQAAELSKHARDAIAAAEKFSGDAEKIADEAIQLAEHAKTFSDAIKDFVAKTAPETSPNVTELDKQRTGKTGVAFGLLRCRRGGKDVKIVNKNVDASGEMIFPYFLGDAGTDGNTFTVRIGRDVGYGQWVYFTFADEPEFEICYTSAPRALQNKLPVAQVSMAHCIFDDDEASDDEDVGVYVRKVSPNEIEYAVGRAEDFAGEFGGKIYRQKL